MPRHYPRPSFIRRFALACVQAVGFALGIMALYFFRAGHCLTTGTAIITFALLAAAFLPLTLATTLRGPRGTSRPLKFATFGLFFAALLGSALFGPDTMCSTVPSAPLSALYVAIAGLALWGLVTMLGPKPSSGPDV